MQPAGLADQSAPGVVDGLTSGFSGALPLPSALLPQRLASAAAVLAHDGTEFQLGLPYSRMNNANPPVALMSPNWHDAQPRLSDASYCTFAFNLTGYAATGASESINFAWAAPGAPVATDDMWVGLAEWGHDRWRWFGCPSGTVLPVNGLDAYIAGEGTVLVCVLLLGTADCGLSRVSFQLEVPAVTVTAVDIQALGATGGLGTNGDIFSAGAVASITANKELTLRLNSVSGMYDGAPFSSGALAPGMTPAAYDAICSAVRDEVHWQVLNAGALYARFTSDWFVPAQAYGGSGDPGVGQVCPDHDPESTAATNPEGELELNLPAGSFECDGPVFNVQVPAELQYVIRFDLLADPNADVIEGFYTGPDYENKVTYLVGGAGMWTILFFNISSWAADGSDLPIGPECKVEAVQFGIGGGDAEGRITVPWDPDDDNDPRIGYFNFFHAPEPIDMNIFICKVDGVDVTPGVAYMLRFYNGTCWSSINLPPDLLGIF